MGKTRVNEEARSFSSTRREREGMKETLNAGLSLIFEVVSDIQRIASDLSCCSEVNMLVLYQSSRGYTAK